MSRFLPLLALALVGWGCSPPDRTAQTPDLTVFVAASLSDVIETAAEAFAEEHGVRVYLNAASSGTLAQQVAASGEADVFLSASEPWLDFLEARNRLLSGSRRTLLSNQLVVVARAGSPLALRGAEDLAVPAVRFVSLGDPTHVPAGRYARAWLEAQPLPSGQTVWAAVEPKLLPGPDVRAALTQVQSGPDLAGIVYRTDYQARAEDFELLFSVPLQDSPAIAYGAAVIAGSDQPKLGRAFLNFLETPPMRHLFQRHGFVLTGP